MSNFRKKLFLREISLRCRYRKLPDFPDFRVGGASSKITVSVFGLEGAGTVAFVGFRIAVIVFFVDGTFETFRLQNTDPNTS